MKIARGKQRFGLLARVPLACHNSRAAWRQIPRDILPIAIAINITQRIQQPGKVLKLIGDNMRDNALSL